MLELRINDEFSSLQSVVLGITTNNVALSLANEGCDSKSLNYQVEETDLNKVAATHDLELFNKTLLKYQITVYRPELIGDFNQIFVRNMGFVIDSFFIKSNSLPDKETQHKSIDFIIKAMNPSKVILLPEEVCVEGGDVLLWENYVFVGTYKGSDYTKYNTARTNVAAVQFIRNLFPGKIVKDFDLIKSNIEPKDNVLHLDCCFQPLGQNKAIIYKRGFREESDYLFLVNLFGKENLFYLKRNEMYNKYSNVFSIKTNVVVSDKKFKRLNKWLRANDFIVEEILFTDISKQEHLLRCSTLPLLRK